MFAKIKSFFAKLNPFKGSSSSVPTVKHVPTNIEQQIDGIITDRLYLYVNLLKFNPSLTYWQNVLKAIGFAESGFNLIERYEEKGISDKDQVTGLQNWSEGIFQLSQQDSKIYGCAFDWSKDKLLDSKDLNKTIFNVFNQVDGTLKILDKQLKNHGVLITEKSYWATLRPSRPGYKRYVDQFNMYQNQKTPISFEPVKEVPVVITEEPKQETGTMKIAIIEGHGDKSGSSIDTGSTHYNGKTELAYTREVTKSLNERKAEIKHEIQTFQEYPSVGECAKKVLAWKPDMSMELHTNAYNGSAKGCQVNVLSNDPASLALGRKFSEAFCKKFGRVLRDQDGVVEMGRKERGLYNLAVVEALPASILCEPFFGDNKADYVEVKDYVDFLIEFLNSL